MVPDGGGVALGARREESIGIVRIRLRDADGFLGNSRISIGSMVPTSWQEISKK